MQQEKQIFCLSLLSGGLKSCFQAVVLAEIELRTGHKTHELFDYCVGVSAGALCLSFLTVPKEKNAAVELIEFFKVKLKNVFEMSTWRKIITLNGLLKSKYQNRLRATANETFGKMQIADCKTNVMILSYSLTNDRAKYFKSWDRHEGGQIADICLASSAIPGMFSPVCIDEEYFFDGALVSSNGSTALLCEILKRDPNQKESNIKMLTIGVGTLTEKLSPDASLLRWIWSDNHSPLLATLLKDEVANDTARLMIGPRNHFYFNPSINISEYNATTDFSKLDELLLAAQRWIFANSNLVDEVCKHLCDHFDSRAVSPNNDRD